MDCTEEALAQAFNHGEARGKGYYSGMPRSVWAQGGLDAVIRGAREAGNKDPFHQFALPGEPRLSSPAEGRVDDPVQQDRT